MLREMQHKSSQLHKMTRPDAQSALTLQAAGVDHLSRSTAAGQRPAAA
jgi:hypothetical protein